MTGPSRKILLIGWDAADWKVIHPLLDAGKMPNLEKLVTGGVMGNLATLYPDLSPMLWTSIATGKRPFRHGILGFTEPDPSGGGIRPISNLSRKTKAIWNILGQTGKKCNVVGWWPSHPAEPVNGVMVSNHYQRATAPFGKPWSMPPGTVHPKRLVWNLAELRVHPQELDVGLVMNFVPRLAEIDQEKDRRIESIAKIIADSTTVCRATTALMHHEPWDFTAVYFDGIDHFCHGFMQYHPPKPDWVAGTDFELYKNVVESGYIYHDILLGHLLNLAGDDTTIILVSDHGFHSDHLRPRHIPDEPAGPAVQHRHYGIFVMKGPGILEDEAIYGATLLDICPTALVALGLPVGEDMDGKPLVNAYRNPPDFKTVSCWDDIPGDDGRHPPDKQVDPVEAREAINQLVALGYIEEPPEDREKAVEETVRELRYNQARSYMDANRPLDAIPILEEIYEKWPDEHRFGIQLVSCHEAVGRIGEVRPILEELFRRRAKSSAEAVEKLKKLGETYKDASPEDIGRKAQMEIRKLRARAGTSPYALEYLMGSLHYAEGNMADALVHLQNAEKADPGQPGIYLKIGNVFLKMKRFRDAEKTFEKALALDPENAAAYLGLGRSRMARGRFGDAAEAAMESVGLLYHNPRAHFLLGKALDRIGDTERAVQALKVAVFQNPNFAEAHDRLAAIFETGLGDIEEAAQCRERAALARRRLAAIKDGTLPKDDMKKQAAGAVSTSVRPVPAFKPLADPAEIVTIVTGLPRSGTSMMMQMLSAGGIPALTDGRRQADQDNPRGYFEFEKAGKLKTDREWLPDAKGKAVKIVAQLLPFLPKENGFEYRVVLMERDPDEVLPSQHDMLKRQGKSGADLPDGKLKTIFSRQVNEILKMLSARGILTLCMDYNKSIAEPAEAASRVNAFFGGRLDELKMAMAVDPALYRHRNVTEI